MKKLTLTNCAQDNITVLENEFIDRYMPGANGEYVKVYLLVLRHLNDASGILSISEMADVLECTEKDVLRALNYWKKQGLLDFCDPAPDASQAPAGQTAAGRLDDNPKPAKNSEPSSAPNIQQYRSRKERKEFKELVFVAEQYLGKTLSATDIDMITYFYDTLDMSAELIEYLIEYCVENGHKSMHYIQAVALSWNSRGIRTVEEAKAGTHMYTKNCYSVLKAYGIKGRGPAPAELAYIRKWNEEYGFTLDVILEACSRTMNAIHQPNFEYTDSILKNWISKGVRQLKDIESADAAFLKEKERKKQQHSRSSADTRAQKTTAFNNFDERSYNMDDLERRLLQQ